MNADGSGATRLTNFEGDDGRPAWSSDGTRIAFSSIRMTVHIQETKAVRAPATSENSTLST